MFSRAPFRHNGAMTQATHSQITIVEHLFTVPEKGDMKDLGIAISWARSKAEELGIDTSYDDWASFRLGDEDFSIVVKERRSG